jgi:hypothetical protein
MDVEDGRPTGFGFAFGRSACDAVRDDASVRGQLAEEVALLVGFDYFTCK